jgi:hypothetical protein
MTVGPDGFSEASVRLIESFVFECVVTTPSTPGIPATVALPLEALPTAQLRLSKAEADATCEHQSNRADEAVLVIRTNVQAGEHLLRKSSPDTMAPFPNARRFGGRKGE